MEVCVCLLPFRSDRWHHSDLSKQEVLCCYRRSPKDQRQRSWLAQPDAEVGKTQWRRIQRGRKHRGHRLTPWVRLKQLSSDQFGFVGLVWKQMTTEGRVSFRVRTLSGSWRSDLPTRPWRFNQLSGCWSFRVRWFYSGERLSLSVVSLTGFVLQISDRLSESFFQTTDSCDLTFCPLCLL